MRLNGLNLEGMRLNGTVISDARLNNTVLFASNGVYKQNGLMAWFMGNANTNTSADKNIWKNLGSGANATLSGFGYIGGSGWTGNALYFDGVDDTSSVLTLPSSVYTIECVFRKPENKQGARPVTSWSTTGAGFGLGATADGIGASFGLSYGTNYYQQVGSLSYLPNAMYSASVSYNTANNTFYVYVNGALLGTKVLAGFTPNNQIIFANLALNNALYRFKGEVFCTRVYKRFLTSEEMLHNYNVDKAVYGL